MTTPAQEAFAEGFAALASVHASSWTFGGVSFVGVASVLKPDDPRMVGSNDRLFEIQVATDELPSPRPRRSDVLVRDGRSYRITRPLDVDPATGITSILVVEA